MRINIYLTVLACVCFFWIGSGFAQKNEEEVICNALFVSNAKGLI
jgi:hypothetical protein